MQKIFTVRWGILFLVFTILYFFLNYLMTTYVLTDTLYYTSLGGQMSEAGITRIIHLSRKTQWFTYLAIPVLLLVRWSLVVLILYAGVYLFNLEVTTRDIFNIVAVAEYIPLVTSIVKVMFFYLINPSSINDIQNFSLLSLLQVWPPGKCPVFLTYPLQQMSVLEFIYWCVLAMGISHYARRSWRYSFRFVAMTYGIGLALWLATIVFIQLNLAP